MIDDDFPWITLRPAALDCDRWVWDCECSAYDLEDTRAEVTQAGAEHGRNCTKGRNRYGSYR